VINSHENQQHTVIITKLKLPLYLHDFRSEIQFGRVEIALHCKRHS